MKIHRYVSVVLLSLFTAIHSLGDDSIATKSRELLEQARQEEAAAANAAMQGDQATFQEHASLAAERMAQIQSLFESAGTENSDNVEDLKAYAEFRKVKGDYDLAERALLRAISFVPDHAELWFALGEVQALLGREYEDKAIKSLRKAIILDESADVNAKAHAALGALFLQQGLFDFARRELEDAIADDANHVGARITLASLDVRDGFINKASESLDALGEISPQHMSLMQRTMDKALLEFEESRRWMADTAENHLAYAKLLVRARRHAESILPLERAVELDPDNYVAWNLLGSMYRGFENVDGARRAFTRSLEIDPDQPRTRQALDELAESPAPPGPLAPQ
jgi:tetratricopeptide (TPR) repeat protein